MNQPSQILHTIPRTARWLGFYGAVLLAWVVLIIMQAPLFQGMGFVELLRAICSPQNAGQNFGVAFFMWSLMSLAMMAPTAFPTIAAFDGIAQKAGGATGGFAIFISGYLAVWLGFAALAAIVQLQAIDFLEESVAGPRLPLGLGGIVLIAAGLYQFGPVKQACLRACQSPLSFFMTQWKPTRTAALRMGVWLGLNCLGCCWALMTLGFVGGVMNLAFMALATVIMTLEKLPDFGAYITKPLGWILIGFGLGMLGGSFVGLGG